MKSNNRHKSVHLGLLVLLAGAAGGLAEILWVMIYSAFTPVSAAVVAREVTASFFPALAAGSYGMWFGIGIHMALALLLGYAFAYLVWALTLAAVWTVNFFVVLPSLNPAFITLMPYSVTFASKMLFAVAMGGILAGVSGREMAAAKSVAGRI
jgi:hypothetical protein